MSRSLSTSPLRALPARINPKSKLMEVINADGSVTHAINQMLAYVWRKVIPALNPEELAAKHDSSQFIAESLGFFRVCSRAEYPSQLKKLLLLAFFRRDAVLNEFDRHAFGTESTGFARLRTCAAILAGRLTLCPTVLFEVAIAPVRTIMVLLVKDLPLVRSYVTETPFAVNR